MSDGEQEFDLKKKKKKSKKVDFDAFEEDAADGNNDGVAATAEKIEDLDRAFLRLCSFSLSLSRVDDEAVFSTAFSFFERSPLSFLFFVYPRAFESNERSRRRFDAIAQRKSAGFVRLLHRFSMDGWMRALLSLLSLSLSFFFSLCPLVESKFYLTHSLSLSLFRPSFLPNKQKHLKITKYSRRVWQEEKVQEEEEARAL